MLLRKFRKHKSGFTLAELLVALVILGILSLCVYLITQAASFTFSKGQEVISADDVKDIILEYLKQELKTSTSVYLTDDLVADGAQYLKKGNLLFSSEVDGRLYFLSSDVDGTLNLSYTQDGTIVFPTDAKPYFGEGASDAEKYIYGNHCIRVVFSPLTNSDGKKQALKVTVSVYKSMSSTTASVEGSEIIQLVNMEQQNGEITASTALTSPVRYCFYA